MRGAVTVGSWWRRGLVAVAVACATVAMSTAAPLGAQAATVVATISLPHGTVALNEVAAGGAVWSLAADGERGYLYRIDPSTNAITAEIDLPMGTPTGDDLLVADGMVVAGGSLWVPEAFRDEVLRIDPVNGRILHRIATTGRYPDQLTVGGGSVWVNQGEAASVARIDPASNAVVATIPVGRQDGNGRDQPLEVSWDAALNRVLVTLPQSHRVATIDAASQRVRYLSVTPAFPCGRAIPVPGGFWLDDTPCSSNMFHWDDAAGAVTATIAPVSPLNSNLGGVAAGDVLYTAESYCGPSVCRHGSVIKRDATTGAVLAKRASGLGYTALPSIAATDLWVTDFGGLLTRVAHF